MSAPLLVQHKAPVAGGVGVLTVSSTFTSATVTGNLIVVSIPCRGSVTGWTVDSVTDNKGNTYTRVVSRDAALSNTPELWICANATGGSSHTVTANCSGTDTAMMLLALDEVSGYDTIQPIWTSFSFSTASLATQSWGGACVPPRGALAIYSAGNTGSFSIVSQASSPSSWTSQTGSSRCAIYTNSVTASGTLDFVPTWTSAEVWYICGIVILEPGATETLPADAVQTANSGAWLTYGTVLSGTIALTGVVSGNDIFLALTQTSSSTTRTWTITDDKGNTYDLVVSADGTTTPSTGIQTYLYRARNVVGGSVTITATNNAAIAFALFAFEMTGLDQSVVSSATGRFVDAVGTASAPRYFADTPGLTVPAGAVVIGVGNTGSGSGTVTQALPGGRHKRLNATNDGYRIVTLKRTGTAESGERGGWTTSIARNTHAILAVIPSVVTTVDAPWVRSSDKVQFAAETEKSLTLTPEAGDMLVAVVIDETGRTWQVNDTSGGYGSLRDSRNQPWTELTENQEPGSTFRVRISYAKNVAAGSTTVRIQNAFGGQGQFFLFAVADADTVSPYVSEDTYDNASGSTTHYASTSGLTTAEKVIAFAAGMMTVDRGEPYCKSGWTRTIASGALANYHMMQHRSFPGGTTNERAQWIQPGAGSASAAVLALFKKATSGGSAATFDSTADVSLLATSSTTTAINLASSAVCSLSATSTLDTASRLASAADVSLSAASSLTTACQLSAAAVANLAATSSLTNGINLAAVATASLTATSALSAQINLASLADAVLSATSDLTAPGATGSLESSCTLSLSATSDMTTSTAIASSAVLSLSGASALTTGVSLSSTAIASLAATGALDTAVALASSAPVSLQASSVLDTVPSLASLAGASLAATSSLTTAPAFASLASLALSAASVLTTVSNARGHVLSDLAAFLVAGGFGTLGTDLFVGTLPDGGTSPAAALTLTPGRPPDRTFDGGVYVRPRVRVIARGASYAAGRLLAERLAQALAQIANQTIEGTQYGRVDPTSSVGLADIDTKGRYVFAVNFDVDKAPNA